ncbi:MAG TPA: hypothetical protein VFW71_15490 [Actinomycetota bacterium]|nr:hypothetical protein [Actinomycetota bacterium]
MQRQKIDRIVSWIGVLMTAALVGSSALLLWGAAFVDHQIHNQLATQEIFFPAAGSAALAPKTIGPYLDRYAGQQLVNGAQAEAYADHFIAVHLSEVAKGQTYAQVSAAAQADPTNTTLTNEVNTLFKGETLRGLLLSAYAWWRVGQLALIAGLVAGVLAVVMAALSILGFWHRRQVLVEAVDVAARPVAAAV